MSGCLFTVVAPSGAGKSSLVAGLLARDSSIALSVSFTTRPPRAGEADGREYHFVTRTRFEALIAADEFLEHAEVYGNLYGTSRKWIESRRASGTNVLLEIDWQGARAVKKLFPDMVYIYILPPSIEELQRRLVKRGKDSTEVIQHRLSEAREDLKHVHKADYVIINEDFSVALDDLFAVTRACQLTVHLQISRHADLLK
ncbi:MAG: guanylate kinase [Aeromicrobium sp.]|nr:guanylate kinase [Burkholderiales bacterium]